MKDEFLKSDVTWEFFGIRTQDEFIDRFLIKGKFHNNVPEKIIRDYKKVERLIFYSYFYYPLIDEAFGKSTRIFEASIDLKFKELGLESDRKFEALDLKINKLKKFYSTELINQFKEVKKLRNLFAHHKAGRLMGFAILRAFTHNINMINSIFLQKEEVIMMEATIEQLRRNAENFKQGLFLLQGRDEFEYLVWSAIPYTSWKKESNLYSYWAFHPVLKPEEINDFNQIPEPFLHHLKNVNFENNTLHGIDEMTGKKLILKPTDNSEFRTKMDEHEKLSINLGESNRHLYAQKIKRTIGLGIADFIYKYAW